MRPLYLLTLIIILLIIIPTLAKADSSDVSGSGSLSASASIDFRIVIPPKVTRREDGSLTDNFGDKPRWQYSEDENGVVTLSSP